MLGMFNPPSTQIGMVAFPPLSRRVPIPVAAPFTERQGLHRLRRRRPRLRDRHDQRRLQAPDGRLDPRRPVPAHGHGPASSCIQSGGNTSYSEALRQAQAELLAHGPPERPRLHRLPDRRRGQHRQRVRVGHGLSAGQRRRSAAVPDGDRPRQRLQGGRARRSTASATRSAATSTARAAVGESDADDNPGRTTALHPCTQADTDCDHYANGLTPRARDHLVHDAQEIASPGNFYNQPNAGDLSAIFAAIATDIGQGSSRLVDDNF